MTSDPRIAQALIDLDDRLRTILPEEYQDSYETMEPVSMGTAGLKFGPDGRVAWNEIWGSFCDLAMAGGPPHKGTLLEPASIAEIDAQPERYADVVEEICRGVTLATRLVARVSPHPGWVRIVCRTQTMAGWLLRAIVMENVSVRIDLHTIDLPASPSFRLEKEIKNVVTVIAKTSHYWLGHVPATQQRAIADMFWTYAQHFPLVEPGRVEDVGIGRLHAQGDAVAHTIEARIGLGRSGPSYGGWLGLECGSVRLAVWMMRALVASNVLARREGTVLFVPVNPLRDPDGGVVSKAVARIHELAVVRGLV